MYAKKEKISQHQTSNLRAQSETLLSLSFTPLAESLANPKAGCHYLDQTSQAHTSLLIGLCVIDQTSEPIKKCVMLQERRVRFFYYLLFFFFTFESFCLWVERERNEADPGTRETFA